MAGAFVTPYLFNINEPSSPREAIGLSSTFQQIIEEH